MRSEATIVETWEHKPENRAGNNGYGVCNLSSGQRCHCMFGGIGCNVDHRFIKLLRAAQDGRNV